MKYTTAFMLFCNINSNGVSQSPVKVWNYRSQGDYPQDSPDETLSWNTGYAPLSPTIGKYIVIGDYKTAVRDQYKGVYGTYARYKTLTTDKGYQLGFTVPQSWAADAFPQKVNVEMFEANNSFNLVSTGMTGLYTLSNLGVGAINYPQWMQGAVWAEIHEWVDDTNATGTLLKVADSNVSMPYDWTSIVFLRHQILSSGVFAYPFETMDDPTTPNTATYVLNLIYNKAKGSTAQADKWMGFDWYMTEAQLYALATSLDESPVTWWRTAGGANLNLTASGTRMFGVINLAGTFDSWPKAALPQDIGAMILMQVSPTVYGYAYTFPASGTYPTNTESDMLAMSRSSMNKVSVKNFVPAPPMTDGLHDDSTIYGLPCSVVFRADMLNVLIADYIANSTIAVNTQSERVECKQLWTSWLSGTLNNLLFVSPSAYVGVFGSIELVPFVESVFIVSLLQDASYRFFFEKMQCKNITFDEDQDVYITAKFATVFSDRQFEVRIFGGDSLNITAGEQPIIISEENTKYAFEPIRDQSGYIQLLNQYSMKRVDSIIPPTVTDRPVGLYDIQAQKYVWLGFIKPEVFENNPYAYREIVKLPIIGLSYAARSVEFTTVFPNNSDVTVGGVFATALYLMMKSHPIYIEDVVFDYAVQFFGSTNGITMPLEQSWMKAKVNTSFFREEDEDNQESWAYNCAGVLKILCEFFGLTMRIQGTTVYFLALDDVRHSHRLGKIRFSSLVATGFVDDYQPAVTYITRHSMPDVFAGNFASTQTRQSLSPALSEVSVRCDKDVIEESIDIWGSWIIENQWSRIVSGSYPSSSFSLLTEKNNEVSNVTAYQRFYIMQDSVGYNGWEPQAQVLYQNFQEERSSLTAWIRRTYLIQNAVLSVDLQTKAYVGTTVVDVHSEDFIVIITNRDTGDTLTTRVRLQDGYVEQQSRNRYYPDYSGEKVMVYEGDDYFYGRIQIQVICKNQTHTNPEGASGTYRSVITKCSLSITPLLGLTTPRTEFRHKIFKYAAGGSKSVTSKLISSYFPSIQNRVTSVERYDQTTNDYNPSENLAQRMADYHGKPRRAYKLPIKGIYSDTSIDPTSYINHDGRQYASIAVETDVKSESYNLTLIEMPTEVES